MLTVPHSDVCEGYQEVLDIPRSLRLVRFLLEDLLQAGQEPIRLAGIQTEYVICHIWRVLVCRQVDALIAHNEEVVRSKVDLMQDGDGAIALCHLCHRLVF
jgi:hypothetical protein